MIETLAHGYSSERTQRELSNEYHHDSLNGFQTSLHPCAVDKVASALKGLTYVHQEFPHSLMTSNSTH